MWEDKGRIGADIPTKKSSKMLGTVVDDFVPQPILTKEASNTSVKDVCTNNVSIVLLRVCQPLIGSLLVLLAWNTKMGEIGGS